MAKFDPYARAQRVIDFIELLIVPSGNGQGQPFKLQPFQTKFIRAIYRTDKNGKRIVRRAALSLGRKNGKTALLAALVLVHLIGPEAIPNGELYSAANSREQASVVFKFVKQMIAADPELATMPGLQVHKGNIAYFPNGSFYRTVSAEANNLHGLLPSFVIIDEMGAAKNGEVYDVMNTAMSRGETLLVTISTQANDPQHVFSQLVDAGLSSTNEDTICHLYTAPEGCAIDDVSAWQAANPAMGSFLDIEHVASLASQAEAQPGKEPAFRNLILNQRVSPYATVIPAMDWKACGSDEGLKDGEDIILALDMADKIDLAGLVGVSANADDTRVDAWFFKPSETLDEQAKRDRQDYGLWVRQGHLEATHGPVIDASAVAMKIIELSRRFNVVALVYDPWRIDKILREFDLLGFPAQEGPGPGLRIEKFVQGEKSFTPAIEALEEAVFTRNLKHQHHPILTWNVMNAVAFQKPNGNRVLDKSKSRLRIDGAVALTMAVGFKSANRVEAVAANPWEDPSFSLFGT